MSFLKLREHWSARTGTTEELGRGCLAISSLDSLDGRSFLVAGTLSGVLRVYCPQAAEDNIFPNLTVFETLRLYGQLKLKGRYHALAGEPDDYCAFKCERWEWDEWAVQVFWSNSALLMVVIIALCQLPTQLVACDKMLGFFNLPGHYYTVVLPCLFVESIGLTHSTYLLKDFLRWITGMDTSEEDPKKAMNKNHASNKFLIDGFPRAIDQAMAFEEQVGACAFTLYLDCPEDVMRGRLLERGKSSGRVDDNEATIVKRFKVFQMQVRENRH